MSVHDKVQDYLNDEDERLSYLAKEIWDHPEIGLQEKFAADLLSKELAEAGFTIERRSDAHGLCRHLGIRQTDHRHPG